MPELYDKVIIVGPDGEEASVVGGALSTSGGGGGGGGGAVTVADGADVNAGAVADAVVAGGAAGTMSAKLRRLTTDLASVVTKLAGGLPAALGAGGGVKVDGSGTALPVSGTVTATPSGTQAASIADGSDVAEGALADAVVAAGATGSVSAKLRRLTTDLAALIAQVPATLGQKTMANSMAVVIASDQAPPAFTYGSGEKAGSTSASQFATVTTKWVKVKAEYDNAGRVYIGISGVTKADGSTDTTTGWQLVAGDEIPWLPVSNLNQLYLICDNAGDDVTYMYLV